jgi:hypothetical protein
MGRRLWAAAALLVIATACGDGSTVAGEPGEPSTGLDPTKAPHLEPRWHGSMKVSPEKLSPCEQVAMRFPDRQTRGIAFALDAWEDSTWRTRFYLTSDGGSLNSTPTWWSIEDDENRAVIDIGIGGPGPDHVLIPESAATGTYRLCTANAAEKACALVTVTR